MTGDQPAPRDWRGMSHEDIMRDVDVLAIDMGARRLCDVALLPLAMENALAKSAPALPAPTMTRQQRRYLARKGRI